MAEAGIYLKDKEFIHDLIYNYFRNYTIELSRGVKVNIKQVFSYYPHSETADNKFKFCPCCGKEYRPDSLLKCSECGYIFYRNPTPVVVVFIEKENQVLLGLRKGRYGHNKWGFPGGFIEFDEDFLTAAHREVKEETNLHIEICSVLNVVTNYISPSLHTIAIVLLAKVVSGEMKPNDDLKVLEWYSFNSGSEIPDMAFDSEKFIIEHIDNLKKSTIPIDITFSKF
ncbi:NUDIX hydrolase [Neobacillus sp. YIM B06451]|uniref:NUDIX hydrolase n=1 Tax=Neobacillus sp. YIM B06451 TaxID=3070994 RepID=UPI00292FC1D3|nr:NUDIX hydrolase [Neobacillus sp. YIM B06451]